MTVESTACTTPLGRIVWGHPIIPQHKTDEHNKKLFNDDGTPQMEISYGLAIPKAEFQAVVWPCMAAESAKGYPNGTPAKFSWKWTDGDGIDPKGKPYSDRAGYAGCFVLAISTRFEAPPVMIFQNGAYYQTDQIKCGDYVTANVEFVVNVPKNVSHTPSLYVNPKLTLLCYEGDEIKGSGPAADPTQVFGAAPVIPAAPAGARPVGAPPAAGGGMPGATGAGGVQQQAATGMPAFAPGVAAAKPATTGMPGQTMPPSPQRPTEPTHIHDNGNGTEQWFVNGAWDGGAHPVAAAPTLPPPATGFVDQAAGNPATGGMPGMPPAR